MDPEIRQELAEMKAQLVFLTDLLDSQTKEHLLNEEAQKLLGKGADWFNQKIKDCKFIRGLHYTGDRSSRYWRRSRLLRWIETQDDPAQQLKDHKKWFREIA